jgi:hypothetical protein
MQRTIAIKAIKKCVLAVVLAWLTVAPAAADDLPTVAFGPKYFADRGSIVTVEGSPTGEGASPDTNRWVLWCYQERRECLEIIIIASGASVHILTPIPVFFAVKVWASDRIVAQRDLACGLPETWLLDRLRNTAEFFGASCMETKPPSSWTIEDPPWLKKVRKRLDKPEPPR